MTNPFKISPICVEGLILLRYSSYNGLRARVKVTTKIGIGLMKPLSCLIVFTLSLALFHSTSSYSSEYPWLSQYDQSNTIIKRVKVPLGYERMTPGKNSFKYWLQRLPLKKENSSVYLYNGEKKLNQQAHSAVIDIDVGKKNLQQCADAVMRLKSEYHFSTGNYNAIHFKFTSGHMALFTKWIAGHRPSIKGNKVKWTLTEKHDASYKNFRNYLDTVFMYAGSFSLNKELQPVSVNDMAMGDVFIQGGFPGHAVIVVDMAVQKTGREKLFLLAQSYMPAQDIHLLKNPTNQALSPWYETNFGEELVTPEWQFYRNQLKRFNN